MNKLKKKLISFKKKIDEKVSNIDSDDILSIALGLGIGCTLVCAVNSGTIASINDKVKNMDADNLTRFKIATNNDFKAYNNHMLNAYRIDAIVQALKSTHPGITEMVADAEKVAADRFLELPYEV